jgi:hypothetical protein
MAKFRVCFVCGQNISYQVFGYETNFGSWLESLPTFLHANNFFLFNKNANNFLVALVYF